MRRSLLLPVLAAVAVSSPALAGQSVAVDLIDVNGVSITRDGLEIDLVGEVQRDGWPAITLQSIDYKIYMGDEIVGQGSAEPDVKIRSGEAQQVELPCALDLGAGAMGMASALQSGELDLRVEGEVRVRTWIFPRTVSFETQLADL